MNPSESALIQQLTHTIACKIPEIYGRGSKLAEIEPDRLDRRYSFMFRFWMKRMDGSLQPLLVKIPRESWMRSLSEAIESEHIGDVIQKEFVGMDAIAKAIACSGNPGLFAIRPGAVLPEYHALMIEEIPIQMLKVKIMKPAVMLGSSQNWQQLEIELKRAGEWLKVIHDHYRSQTTASLESLKLDATITMEVAALEDMVKRSLDRPRDLFLRLYERLKADEVPLTFLHHDYQPGNVFITADGKIGALDPNWGEIGPGYQDLSTMLVYPMTRKEQVMLQGILFRPSLQQRYERAVLSGYCVDLHEPDPMLCLFCALTVLMKWRMNEELLRSGRSWHNQAALFLVAPWIREYFERMLCRYLRRGLKNTPG